MNHSLRKVAVFLIVSVMLTACSTDAGVPQPTQRAVPAEEPTAAATPVPTPLPTVPTMAAPAVTPAPKAPDTPLSVPMPNPVAAPTPELRTTATRNAAPTPTPKPAPANEPVVSHLISGSPELHDCLRQVLGNARFNTLAKGASPSQEELDQMSLCKSSDSTGGGRPTAANFKVAFIGDQGLGESSVSVLELIRDEGADMVLHQGDFDYEDDPDAWDRQINSVLGPDYPYFASVGNHDTALWPAYQAKLQTRLDKIAGAVCIGDLGVQSACSYKGLFFILSGDRRMGSGHEDFIRNQLAANESIWRICSWHKNHRLMQTGDRPGMRGWGLYEECRKGGAIIATGHHHTYSRTHLMDDFETQSIASTSNTLVLSRGKSFAFVSGLGGVQIVGQDDGLAANPWWAAVYNSSSGANYGALFCAFNENGVENRAHCYFKDISGKIADDFYLEVQPGGGEPYIQRRSRRTRAEPALTLPPPVPTPPFEARQYQGFWEPGLKISLAGELEHLKSLGVNTMSFVPSRRALPDGTFDTSREAEAKQFVIARIVEAHENGIQVYLVPSIMHHTTLPDRSLAETFLANFTPFMLEWADIAEQYGVALFSPGNELDKPFPRDIVGAWLNEIIPKIDERYSGLTITKNKDVFDMDYSGYDYVGFTKIGLGKPGGVREEVELAKKYAERDGVRGVIISEFGWDVRDAEDAGVGEEKQAKAIEQVFRESWGEVDGYFVISWLLPGYSIKGKPAEKVVEQWFTAADGD